MAGSATLNGIMYLLIAATLFSGCDSGPKLGQVQGTIQLDDKPLANVLVTFVPDRPNAKAAVRSMGISDASGRFELRSESHGSGAVSGRHRVFLEDMDLSSAPRSDDGTLISVPPAKFPYRYGDPGRSPLIVELKEDPQFVRLGVSSQE